VSLPWVITVVNAAVKPVIVTIENSTGMAIPPGSNTFATSVTLSGTAEPDATVEIDDGTTSWGTAPAPGGAWTKTLAGLPLGAHSMTALTGADISDPWPFTVIIEVQPTITSVRDSKGEVGNGGSTTETTVSLVGKAAANQQVQILDNGTNKTTAPVNANGDSSSSLTGLGLGGHSVTAKGLYGSEQVSTSRTFNVIPAIPPLVIDTSLLTLNGAIVRYGKTPSSPPAGSPATRSASGGHTTV